MTATFAACATLAVACGGTSTRPSPRQVPSASSPRIVKEAQDVFRMRCAPCHGESGKGDGPAAPGLTPKPRDFSQPTWQRAIADPEIDRVIIEGGIAIGMSPVMPSHPDLVGRPEVVTALRRMLRGFVVR